MAWQTMVILRTNISSGQVPPERERERESYITVQYHLWLARIIKKVFWGLLFIVRRSSSNPAHFAQDFSLMTNFVNVPV